MKQLIKKIKITSTIKVITGLHIGGGNDNIEIGGIDNSVIKLQSKNNQPYIPGSSIKGKMRCLLERIAGVELGKDETINKLFGSNDTKSPHPSQIIVRDAYLTDDCVKQLLAAEMDMPFTESKWENSIKRVEGVADNPRQTERVPAGAQFAAEFIIDVWDDDREKDLIALFEKGLNAIENDFLGGCGSRGYGQVEFANKVMTYMDQSTDWNEKPYELK